jgi:predicted metal-dependent HD superfamily phosphohydrolase
MAIVNSSQQNTLLISQLRLSWFGLLEQLQVDPNLGETIFANLIKAYSGTARHYHNLHHLQHILNSLTEVRESISNFPALQLCAWFHDYIYDPQAVDNEMESAIAAEKILSRLRINFDTLRLVQQIILSTRKHEPFLEGTDNLIFLDVDLSILGTSADRYLAYSQAIRQEYSYLSDRDYQQGRKQVLTQFLARERIYYTDYFYQKLESTARKNLQTEINSLISK